MRIFLVRHGRSVGNDNPELYRTIPDHAITLSDLGIAQAERVGDFFANYFELEASKHPLKRITRNILNKKHTEHIRMWNSPATRARQTASLILNKNLDYISSCKEHDNLIEQQFGLFDGVSDNDLSTEFPKEYQHYNKTEQEHGRYFATMPMGESRFNVAMRVHQSFGTFHRDHDKHGIKTIIIVAHGVTNRVFAKQWMHKPYEWLVTEKNPENCSVRLLENGIDKGYIYNGG